MTQQPAMLQIIATDGQGGAEKHTRLITKAFRAQGLPVILIFQPGPYAAQYKSLERYGVECIEYPLRNHPFRSIAFVRRLIKERSIHYVHSHMHWADFIAAGACFGLKNIRLFSTIHFLTFDISHPLVRLRAWLMTIVAFHQMTRIFGVSTDVARRARRGYALTKKKVVVTLNSIDFDELRPDPATVTTLIRDIKDNGKSSIIMCAGILSPIKGQHTLIEAMPRLLASFSSLKLVLLGEGDAKQELIGLAESLGVTQKVLFAGHQTNIADWLSIADIYAQPSLVDPLPRALLEAMYLQRAVVVSAINTMQEVVKDGATGLTARVADTSDLTRAIERLLHDQSLAQTLGQNARQFVIENCSMDLMARRIRESIDRDTSM